MKYLDKFQQIELDNDKKYVVMDSIVYENENFVFLMNPDEIKDQLIALVSENEDEISIDVVDINETDNKELINNITEIFSKNALEELSFKGE